VKISSPRRTTRTFTQHLAADPRACSLYSVPSASRVVGALGPGRRVERVGVCEPDCVFVTSADPHDAIWFVTRHDADAGLVEMLKVTPGLTACKIGISLSRRAAGTDAVITYSHTSLGPAGDALVDAFTAQHYAEFMTDWESRLNHYLETGKMLQTASS